MLNELVGAALTDSGSPAVVTGNGYWGPPPDGDGEYTLDVGETLGEGTGGASREMVVVSFRDGDLCRGRSL